MIYQFNQEICWYNKHSKIFRENIWICIAVGLLSSYIDIIVIIYLTRLNDVDNIKYKFFKDHFSN